MLRPGGAREDSAQRAPGDPALLAHALLPGAGLPRPLAAAIEPWRSTRPRRVGWAVGSCVVARTELLRRLGPFDERTFMYAEDLDLGLRAADAGVETWFWPAARVLHRGAHSSRRVYGGEPFDLLARRRREVVRERRGAAPRGGRRPAPAAHLRRPAAAQARARARRRGRAAPPPGAAARAPRGGRRVSAPVAINGRATVRREIGGVERVAIELAARLPALRPERYRVLRPPPALAHAAGHVWEQALLPLAARGSRLLLSPRQPRAAGRREATWSTFTTPLRCASPPGFPAATAPGTGSRCAGSAAARGCCWCRAPSCVASSASCSAWSPSACAWCHRAWTRASRPAPPRAPAPPGSSGPTCSRLGTDSARKNLALLERLTPELEAAGLDVLLAGSTRPYLRGEPGGARRLGYVPDAALPALYAHAAVLALPSLYEGFGLPCLEAMACGTPVVAADRAALPEACGGAALLADPADAAAFGAALLAAAGPERERLRAAGLERARELSWERSAQLADAAVGELLA